MTRGTRVAVALLAGGTLAGCGRHVAIQSGHLVDQGSLYNQGRDAFVSVGCGGCHTVAAAHTNGQIGPDFDTSEQLSRAQILSEVDAGDGVMPSFKDRLTPAQKRAVIEFVYVTMHRRR